MPLDPSLDELSSEQQQQMTHQPEPPNPAAPYVEAVKKFPSQGLTGAFPQLRQHMPGFINTLGDLVQSPAARDVFSTANVGGVPLLETLRMEAAPASEFFSTFGAKDNFKLISKETGQEMGRLHATYNAGSKDLYINYMGSNDAGQGFGGYKNVGATGWGMGTHEIQTLGPEILKNYPDTETVSFLRLPGIRTGSAGKAGRQSRTMKFKVNKTPDGNMTLELIEAKSIPHIEMSAPGSFRIRETSVPDALSGEPVPVPEPPPPPPPREGAVPRPPPLPSQSNESWEQMRQRQDAEWAALMQRLFGNR